MDEEILTGGSINTVTRKGDVVFRNGGEWVPAVHKVLEYLNNSGFSYSPKPLGVVPDGREMISFLPGESMMRPWRQPMFDDDGLIQAAKMLRSLHNITQKLTFPKDTKWQFIKAGKNTDQIIRHGDLGPWNTLWQGDKLTGLIDWDFAEPGDAITDLAQLIAYFVPFKSGANWEEAGFKQQPDYRQRLSVIQKAYGKDYTEQDIILALDKLQTLEISRIKKFGAKDIYPWDKWLKDGEAEKTKTEQDWLHNEFSEHFRLPKSPKNMSGK